MIASFVFVFCACKKSEPEYYTGSYVNTFLTLTDDPLFYHVVRTGIIVNDADKTISTDGEQDLDPSATYSVEDKICLELELSTDHNNYASLINDVQQTKALQDAIGDNHLKRPKRVVGAATPWALVDTLEAVTITCSADYDGDHPAGTSLNDLFGGYFTNPYRYVFNDYRIYEKIDEYDFLSRSSQWPYMMTGGKLSEQNLGENPSIGSLMIFVLNSPPETTGTYTFTVSIQTVGGQTHSIAMAPVQIEGEE